jgi:putative addiction module component (TIGR02574 family)
MKAGEFDSKFDEGEDVSSFLDIAGVRRRTQEARRSGIDVAGPGSPRQTDRMHPSDLDLTSLSAAERIQLAEDLWDSVAAETGGLPLTVAQQTELDRRLVDLESDPAGGESWGTVRARIEGRLDKTE